MLLHIGEKKASLDTKKGIVKAVYENGKTEVLNAENTKYVYLNPEKIISVVVFEDDK